MDKAVILANGRFPEAGIPLGYLKTADFIVCCDGAVDKLVDFGLEPGAIVGDMDSITIANAVKYKDRIFSEPEDQDSNDLTKAVRYCLDKSISEVVILGATGLREDHTLGNISLLADYAEYISAKIVSDFGFIIPVNSNDLISSRPGQQISLFAMDMGMKLKSSNLKYPLDYTELKNLWMGTLNESLSDTFSIEFNAGRLLVFLEF